MNASRLVRVGALLLAAITQAAFAQAPDGSAERPFTSKLEHYSYVVDKEGRATVESTRRFQVLTEPGIEALKTFSFSFSTSIETGEILEAYTFKKDGRKLPVPADNYQRQTSEGRSGARPFFSDRTSYSVVFPDVAVGDSVHVRYRIVAREAIFPGHFSVNLRFSPYYAQEDVLVTVSAPKELKLRQQSHHVDFSRSEQDGRQILQWKYANPRPREVDEDADGGLWWIKEYPNLFVSTLASYEAIAQAYGARATAKAAPTPRIRELSATIVGAETDPKAKARKLYEWVSRNITYGGNCIGVGAVVPRDVDVVLDNRMGDCKDHATLLQALFTAGGIRSEQVLINAGDDYELPEVPVVSMVNHVMNYLPEFDLYLDATAKDIPFGYLPHGSYSKQVLHVGRDKALAQIPGFDHRRSRQDVQMALKISETGAASGSMKVKLVGADAAAMRSYMRELKGQAERDFVKNALGASGYRARGQVDRGNVEGMGDEYEYSVKFEIDNYLRSRSGVLYFMPLMRTPHPVMNFASFEEKPAPKRRQVCWGFHSSEKLDIEIPADMEILSLPGEARLKGALVDFEADYVRTGDRISIARKLDDKTPGSICSAELFADFLRQAIPVGEHLRTQVVFKRK